MGNNDNGAIARGGPGHGTFQIENGGSALFQGSGQMNICNDNGANETGNLNVFGGTLTLGSASSPGTSASGAIAMCPGGTVASSSAIVYQTNGTINSWGGIFFGANSGSFSSGFAAVTNSGGFLYLGQGGIQTGSLFPGTTIISLSGGTLGTLNNWSCSMPITLDAINGNITFQTANIGGSPYNITLSGAITGPGGLYVTGGGILTLSGANNFAGSTSVSNGTLMVATTASGSTNGGAVTVDGSAGSPTLALAQEGTAQFWFTGPLTFQNGATALDFSFSSFQPSTTTAPIQVSGNLSFASTPSVTVAGTALSAGTYPLITCTGTISGIAPTSVNLPGYATGTITTSGNSIVLVITTGSAPALYWAVGNGAWDFTSANWRGESTRYADGDVVIFDDTASGASPITITLNTIVNPGSLAANNSAKKYVVSGSGSIAGSASVSLLGAGTLTLATTNSYNGGTTLSSGRLNINNGGDSSGNDSAIGTGSLTINPLDALTAPSIDNTSGSNVALIPAITENWDGNFTYVGSSNSLNLGPGTVAMNQNIVLTVDANNLIIPGSINDNGTDKLTKTGPGTLTLGGNNNYNGGIELENGLLNLGNPGATGSSTLTIDGGSIDNVSGTAMTLGNISYTWVSSFTYIGTTNLDLGPGELFVPGGTITVTILSNMFETDGNASYGNSQFIKAGVGTWVVGGNQGLQGTVTAGTLELASPIGGAIGSSSSAGLIVESNALVFDNGAGTPQVSSADTCPMTLTNGGVYDLNGNAESFYSLAMSSGGTVRDSGGSTSLTILAGNLTLGDTNCQFNVTNGATLTLTGAIVGSGSLVANGLGELDLDSSNSYTGETIIESGALGLQGAGSIGNTSAIYLASSGAALDLSQSSSTTLTLTNGQTLGGFGIVTGLVTTLSGTTLAPGSATRVGTLTITAPNGTPGASTLGGTLLLSLNRTDAQTSSSVSVTDENTLTYGGTLSVTNIGPALQVGDVFHLFPSAVTTFTSISLPTTDATGNTYTWTTNVAVNGSITVGSVTPPINPLPGKIQFSLSGTTLSLGWPTNLGWTLETNAVGLIATNAWFAYPGSTNVTNVNLTIDQSQTNVYFRLVNP
jgi:autotransporter-associated beta strand protein